METDRTKLLVHARRISGLFERAIKLGPDGTLEGKHGSEHPIFIHHSLVFYLVGCMAYLESESGVKSWEISGNSFTDFDEFIGKFPTDHSYRKLKISKAALNALLCIRNACVHNSNDLSRNHDRDSVNKVRSATLPGVVLVGTEITLESDFMEFIRTAVVAVRSYHGDN